MGMFLKLLLDEKTRKKTEQSMHGARNNLEEKKKGRTLINDIRRDNTE